MRLKANGNCATMSVNVCHAFYLGYKSKNRTINCWCRLIIFHTPGWTSVDVQSITWGVTQVLCWRVSSGRRREVEGEAAGVDLHGHHHSQCHGRPGHASLLRRNSVFWLRLRSLRSCKFSTCCSQTVNPSIPASLRASDKVYMIILFDILFNLLAGLGNIHSVCQGRRSRQPQSNTLLHCEW